MNNILLETFKSEKSRANFIMGLIRVAKSDETIDSTERDYFTNAALGLGISNANLDQIASSWDKEDLEIDFETKEESLLFLREAIQLCYIDQHYGDRERDQIMELGDQLGISRLNVAKIETWVEEGIQWANKGNDLLRLEE